MGGGRGDVPMAHLFYPTISWTGDFFYCAYGVCREQELIYFRHKLYSPTMGRLYR